MERYLTTREVAERLGVSTGTVYAWARQGALPARRIGRTVRFAESDIEHQLDVQAMAASENHRTIDLPGGGGAHGNGEKVIQDIGTLIAGGSGDRSWKRLYAANVIAEALRELLAADDEEEQQEA